MAEPTLLAELVAEAGDWSWIAAEDLVARAAAAVTRHQPAAGIVTVALADDAAVRSLNARFRGKDRPTNVLSFPGGGVDVPGEDPHLGDVILAEETLRREADEQGKRPVDHFIHLVVHGILHVLGHDHVDDEEAQRMETLEIAILSDLGVPDPYAAAAESAARISA